MTMTTKERKNLVSAGDVRRIGARYYFADVVKRGWFLDVVKWSPCDDINDTFWQKHYWNFAGNLIKDKRGRLSVSKHYHELTRVSIPSVWTESGIANKLAVTTADSVSPYYDFQVKFELPKKKKPQKRGGRKI